MIRVVLVNVLDDTIAGLLEGKEGVSVTIINSADEAIHRANHFEFDLAIIGETVDEYSAVKFAEKLVIENPMLNLVLVGTLPEEEFHQATEGLGVLGQISSAPDPSEVDKILDTANRILGQTG